MFSCKTTLPFVCSFISTCRNVLGRFYKNQRLQQYKEDASGNINWNPGCVNGLSPSGSLHDPCQAHHYRVVESNEQKVPSTISVIGNTRLDTL